MLILRRLHSDKGGDNTNSINKRGFGDCQWRNFNEAIAFSDDKPKVIRRVISEDTAKSFRDDGFGG